MNTSSLYNMLVQAEDKKRTAIETLIYALLILSVAASICQAAIQRVSVPRGISARAAATEYYS